MNCPNCGGFAKVMYCKKRPEEKWRRRHCGSCGFRFSTKESIVARSRKLGPPPPRREAKSAVPKPRLIRPIYKVG